MPQDVIFGPVGALALLTFVVLGLIPFRRFRAAAAGEVTSSDFKLVSRAGFRRMWPWSTGPI